MVGWSLPPSFPSSMPAVQNLDSSSLTRTRRDTAAGFSLTSTLAGASHPNPRGLVSPTDSAKARIFPLNSVTSDVQVRSTARSGMARRIQAREDHHSSPHASSHCQSRSTLVADRATPNGFVHEFLRLSPQDLDGCATSGGAACTHNGR